MGRSRSTDAARDANLRICMIVVVIALTTQMAKSQAVPSTSTALSEHQQALNDGLLGLWNDKNQTFAGVDMLKKVLETHPDVNARGAQGFTALIESACLGRPSEGARVLLANGADVNQKDDFGRTALHWAVVYQKLDVVQLLVSHGANVNIKDQSGDMPLHLAHENDSQKIINILTAAGAKDDSGWTELMYAAAFGGHVNSVRSLLKRGVAVNAKDAMGDTALIHACEWDNAEVARVLIDHGADINATNNSGDTALITAITSPEHTNCVKLLLKHRADFTIKNSYRETALKTAKNMKMPNVVALLVAAGAKD